MKFMEINDGYILPVYLDEQHVLRELEEHDFIEHDKLTEYFQQVADNMRSKGLLNKVKKDNKIVYVPNQGDPQ